MISLRDFLPKFLYLSICASDFCTRSPIVLILAASRQFALRTGYNFGADELVHGLRQSWTLGDANDDGEIGPEDFALLRDNFGRDGGPSAPLTTAPEPASLCLLAAGGLALLRRRP